ncbi:type VI secretion system baseplate subunit TssG [Roseospira marina]|uniref:Type VI secretion system baseplate subunit TssG n=1 Tax=Roseospira marina TaxID=140057 RepID=A0A5M6I8M5_9PROT|nr:type VI secretion system baseplate subunit TssG [Roseospira marina]MBB4315287.1 type VI secretion system protein ImpH [Roseospira marina]MBB5088286.1 type VI secretion system protein ImpH [Roseospira marina]
MMGRLAAEPHRFTFLQAVRLWQREARRTGTGRPVGGDAPPDQEAVRLLAHQALSFQPGQVAPPRRRDTNEHGMPHIAATFMGLTGPNGALPQYYTEMVLQRSREHDTAMQAFFDLFNHRLLSLFWRACAKYRLDLSYELQPETGRPDPVTQGLLSLVGLGLPGLTGRLPVEDERILYYGGHFSRRPPSAVGLEQILSDYFGRPVTVEQFHGRWLYLPPEEQTRLGDPKGCRLGVDTVAGNRVWDVQGSLRLRIGPLDWEGFRAFQPGGRNLERLAALARLYVGPEYAFDVQVVLAREAVPRLQMPKGEPKGGDAPEGGLRLGWNTWMVHETPRHDAEEAVFLIRDLEPGPLA